MTGTPVRQTRRPEDLLIGALAALALTGRDTLRTTDKSFHEHFGAALDVYREAGGELGDLSSSYYRDIVSDTFDELDHALITAEQFGLVKFPNPSYSRLHITIPPRVAERLLAEWGADLRPVFERAAEELYRSTYA